MGETEKVVPLMDVRLAAVLLSVPDASGIAAVVDGALNVITKLRISQRTFEAYTKTAFAIGAGATALGPTFVLVVLLRGEGWEPAPLLVRLALNPAVPEQLDAIRQFGAIAQLPVRGYDPTLVPLGIKTIPLSAEMRSLIARSVTSAEEAAGVQPDPELAARLPAGMTPFNAATYAVAQEVEKQLPY